MIRSPFVPATLAVFTGVARSTQTLMLALAAILSLAHPAEARGPAPVSELARDLQGAVVNISTTQRLSSGPSVPVPKAPEGSPFEDFFRDFLDNEGEARRINSLGSGFVIDPSGLIVTNNHVIENADEIIINFADGRKLTVVEIVGRDPKTDLALLRVEPDKPLQAVPFGDSSKMEVGDWVMAIGNPFGLGGSVSLGIISAVQRDINTGPYDAFIQTDAAINRGNSGGPLFNMDGEVIGVNTAIISPTGGSIGIGFALPANTAARVISQLREFGRTRRGWIGVRIQTLSDDIAETLDMDEAKGALVADVTPQGPAAEAGIETGDVIVGFAGRPVDTARQLPRAVAETEIGAEVPVDIVRQGEPMTLRLKVGLLDEGDDGEEASPGRSTPEDDGAAEEDGAMLGLTLAQLSDLLRSEYGIGSNVKGLLVTDVKFGSDAAQRGVEPGMVLIEVSHQPVASPEDVSARIENLRRLGRKTILLLFSSESGDMNYIALPLDQ